MKKIKVFIVEDSILMQKVIADILSSDSEIEVVGTTKYGQEALAKIPQIAPDIVTLDVNLPDMSGLLVLEQLMREYPARVVMLSAYTQKGAETAIKALELGALDFIPKPSGEVSLDLYNFKDEIIAKIKTLAQVNPKVPFVLKNFYREKEMPPADQVVVIGASTGGPKAIMDVMSQMPANCGANFLIVQHMPKGFTKTFAERVGWYSNVRCKEVEDGDLLLKNVGYVAKSGQHMVVERLSRDKKSYCLRLDDTALVNYVKPAVDVTMSSLADTFEGKIIAVILTGMGKDGLEGCRKIKAKGGKIIVQDEHSCVVYGMPRSVVHEGLADSVLPITEIPGKIMEYLHE
jgi:two-component system, chemotaxis family, protein-glutamate methylesterase/glutaminase